jgi:hypothetical protein
LSTCFERRMLIDRLIISMIHYLLSAVDKKEWRLTFLAIFILIISNAKKNRVHKKSSFFGAICKRTEPATRDQETEGIDLVLIFSSRVRTSIFWLSVLEIIAKENTNFRCVRLERKKKKRKLASDYINAVLRTALTRWYSSFTRLRNAVRSSISKSRFEHFQIFSTIH